MIGVDRRSVRRWKAVHHHQGTEALRARRASGRPPNLVPRQLQQIGEALGFFFSSVLLLCHLRRNDRGIAWHDRPAFCTFDPFVQQVSGGRSRRGSNGTTPGICIRL